MCVCSAEELKTNLRHHQLSCIFLRSCPLSLFILVVQQQQHFTPVKSFWKRDKSSSSSRPGLFTLSYLSFFFWSLLCSHYVLLDDPLLYTVYYSSSVLAERRLVTLFSSRRFASAMRQAYAYIPPYTQQCLGLTFDLYIYVQAALPGSAGTHRGVATTIFLFSCFMTQSEQNNRGRKGSQYRDNR